MSIVTRVAVWFTLHPEATLTSTQVSQRFGISVNSVPKSLRMAEEKGWVECERVPAPNPPHGYRNFYRAGSRIRDALKEVQLEAGA